MMVKFQRNGKTFQGKVLFKGFHEVDAPECYQIDLGHVDVYVPVNECEIVEE